MTRRYVQHKGSKMKRAALSNISIEVKTSALPELSRRKSLTNELLDHAMLGGV
jgi:hypothetical protein